MGDFLPVLMHLCCTAILAVSLALCVAAQAGSLGPLPTHMKMAVSMQEMKDMSGRFPHLPRRAAVQLQRQARFQAPQQNGQIPGARPPNADLPDELFVPGGGGPYRTEPVPYEQPPPTYTDGPAPPPYTDGTAPPPYTDGTAPPPYTDGTAPPYTDGPAPPPYTDGPAPPPYSTELPYPTTDEPYETDQTTRVQSDTTESSTIDGGTELVTPEGTTTESGQTPTADAVTEIITPAATTTQEPSATTTPIDSGETKEGPDTPPVASSTPSFSTTPIDSGETKEGPDTPPTRPPVTGTTEGGMVVPGPPDGTTTVDSGTPASTTFSRPTEPRTSTPVGPSLGPEVSTPGEPGAHGTTTSDQVPSTTDIGLIMPPVEGTTAEQIRLSSTTTSSSTARTSPRSTTSPTTRTTTSNTSRTTSSRTTTRRTTTARSTTTERRTTASRTTAATTRQEPTGPPPNRIRGKPHVLCEDDKIIFRASTFFPFMGAVYARGKKTDAQCSARFDGRGNGNTLEIIFPFLECGTPIAGARPGEPNLGVEVIVEIVQPDGEILIQSFYARCASQRIVYEKDEIPRRIEEALEELRLIPIKVEQKAGMPDCTMRIVPESEEDKHVYGPSDKQEIRETEIGQKLRIEWALTPPSDAYGFLIRNCTVRDRISGASYTVIDENGCSTDINILGHPHYDTYHDLAIVHWHAFKVPDNAVLGIQCHFEICTEIEDDEGISNCDLLPTPPYCPDLVSAPPNQLLFDFNQLLKDYVPAENQRQPAPIADAQFYDELSVGAEYCVVDGERDAESDPRCAAALSRYNSEKRLSGNRHCMSRLAFAGTLGFTVACFLFSAGVFVVLSCVPASPSAAATAKCARSAEATLQSDATTVNSVAPSQCAVLSSNQHSLHWQGTAGARPRRPLCVADGARPAAQWGTEVQVASSDWMSDADNDAALDDDQYSTCPTPPVKSRQ